MHISLMKEKVKKYLSAGVKPSCVIYQMGKVGSTSLEQALPASLHVHTLYDHHPCQWKRELTRSWLKRNFYFWAQRFLLRRRSSIKIISLVREPVERSVSMFFQELPFWLTKHIIDFSFNTRSEREDLLMEAYEQTFDHDYYDKWFDREIKRFSGIDIFSYNFDNEKGYLNIKHGKYELLVLKMERLNDLRQVICDFSGVEIDLVHTNSGEEKWYVPLYRDFKNKIATIERLPCNQAVKAGKTARYFGYS